MVSAQEKLMVMGIAADIFKKMIEVHPTDAIDGLMNESIRMAKKLYTDCTANYNA